MKYIRLYRRYKREELQTAFTIHSIMNLSLFIYALIIVEKSPLTTCAILAFRLLDLLSEWLIPIEVEDDSEAKNG